MIDDEEPKKIVPQEFPRSLDRLSIDALEAYIGELNAEVERVRKEIEAKQGMLKSAESLFKS